MPRFTERLKSAVHGEQHAFYLSPLDLDLNYTLDSAQTFTRTPIASNEALAAWKGVAHGEIVTAFQYPNRVEFSTRLRENVVSNYFSLDSQFFSLANAINSILKHSGNDATLRRAVNAFPGLRILKQDPWETIACFLMSQNSNVAMIKQRVKLLSEKFGLDLGDGFGFPFPDHIARLPLEELQNCKLGYRAPYLRETAKMITNGELNLQALQNKSYEEARASLLELPGVGPKVADCICLYGLGHMQAFPIDTHVLQVMETFYGKEVKKLKKGRKTVPYNELADFGREKFGPYAGYAQQYLFHLHRTTGCRQ